MFALSSSFQVSTLWAEGKGVADDSSGGAAVKLTSEGLGFRV